MRSLLQEPLQIIRDDAVLKRAQQGSDGGEVAQGQFAGELPVTGALFLQTQAGALQGGRGVPEQDQAKQHQIQHPRRPLARLRRECPSRSPQLKPRRVQEAHKARILIEPLICNTFISIYSHLCIIVAC